MEADVTSVVTRPVTGDDAKLGDAFDLLATVVGELESQRRSVRAAGVKAAMLRRSDGTFNEASLGFPRFKQFLEAAEGAERVKLRQAFRGPDVEVVSVSQPDDAQPANPAERPQVSAPNRIRSDLWDAFTRWDKGFSRFWDRQTGRAHRIPVAPAPSELGEIAELRQLLRSDPNRFVEIEFIPTETTIQWATECAAEVSSEAARGALLRALDEELPIKAFTATVRRLGLFRAWHDFHLVQVLHVLRQWAREHGISEAELDSPMRAPDRTREVEDQRSPDPLGETALRTLMHGLIDEMTVPELLSLAVPLRLVNGRLVR